MLIVFHFIFIQTICYFMLLFLQSCILYSATVSAHSSHVVLLVFIVTYIALYDFT